MCTQLLILLYFVCSMLHKQTRHSFDVFSMDWNGQIGLNNILVVPKELDSGKFNPITTNADWWASLHTFSM